MSDTSEIIKRLRDITNAQDSDEDTEETADEITDEIADEAAEEIIVEDDIWESDDDDEVPFAQMIEDLKVTETTDTINADDKKETDDYTAKEEEETLSEDPKEVFKKFLEEAEALEAEAEREDDRPLAHSKSFEYEVTDFLDSFKKFDLSDRAEHILTQLYTFRHNVYNDVAARCFPIYYNLIIRTDEADVADEFIDTLSQGIYGGLKSAEIYTTTEEKMIRDSKSSRGLTLGGEYKSMVVIKNLKEAPRLQPDLPTAAARGENEEAVADYRKCWAEVGRLVKNQSGSTLYIIVAPERVYKDSLKYNTEIFYRMFGHHIFLKPATPDQIFEGLRRKFDTHITLDEFSYEDGFLEKLRAYFDIVYPRAELKSRRFTDDLYSRILNNYYSKYHKDDEKIFTCDCIPKYNLHVRNADDILGELDDMIGLSSVKELFKNLYKMRISDMVDPKDRKMHMIFAGNPGTGKTTVAKMVAELLYTMGIIKTDKLVVSKPSDFISEWKGGMGHKIAEVLERSYDGVLFIDEAYGFATSEKGSEAVAILVDEMLKNQDRLVIILAGYEKEMRDLLKLNPGIQSRIAYTVNFEDYTSEELKQIFEYHCKNSGFEIAPEAVGLLEDCIAAKKSKEFFGNAREMTSLVNELKGAWSDDYYKKYQESNGGEFYLPKIFTPSHFEMIMPPKSNVSINEMIGLETIKTHLQEFKRQVKYQKWLREKGMTNIPSFPMHMIFAGNPGTGKTTVARLIADDLYSVGILKTNKMICAERKDLVSTIVGDTAKQTEDIVSKAIGGVLFVDEAYALSNATGNDYGHEAIEVLLTAMEDHRDDLVIIFAGYTDEMQQFLQINPGIQSRIGYTFQFEDYKPDELLQIFDKKMKDAGFIVSEQADDKVKEIMEYFQSAKNFGNGRFVDHVMHQAIVKRSNRDYRDDYRNIDACDIPEIKEIIETAPNSMHLYDPGKISEEAHRRTTMHELGHAIVLYVTNNKHVPESISIKNQAGSLGRVKLKDDTFESGNMTEKDVRDHIATLMAGRAAEIVFFGNNATGCSGDYARAKAWAKDMIKNYAMGEIGNIKAKDVIIEADRVATQIIEDNREFLEKIAVELMNGREFTGEEFVEAYNKHNSGK